MSKSVRDGSLKVATSSAQRSAFRSQLLIDVHGVQKAVVRVDAARAQAWNPADRDMIFGAIRKHSFEGVVGFDGLDAVIKRLLQGWIAVTGRAICDQETPQGQAGLAQHAALRHAVGLIAHQQTDYETAEQQLRLALEQIRQAVTNTPEEGGEGCDGTGDQQFEIMHRLALTLRKTPTAAHEAEAISLLNAISGDDRASSKQRLRARKILGEVGPDAQRTPPTHTSSHPDVTSPPLPRRPPPPPPLTTLM